MWRAKRSRQFLNGVMQKVSRYPDYPQRPTKPFSLRSVMAPMVPPISLSPPSISADTMPPVVQGRSELRCAACLLSTPHLHRGVIYPEVWSQRLQKANQGIDLCTATRYWRRSRLAASSVWPVARCWLQGWPVVFGVGFELPTHGVNRHLHLFTV